MLRVEKQASFAVLTIARPEAKNALSHATLAALEAAVRELEADDACRSVVLTGEGAMFAAGGDLRELRPLTSPDDAAQLAEVGARTCSAIMQSRLPFIAALGGPAIGGGAELALACDLRIMAEGASICFKHARMGVTTAWGVLPKLVALIGPGAASRLLLTSEVCSAGEALRLGLVEAVEPPSAHLARAIHWANEIAHGAPLATSGLKQLIVQAGAGADGDRALEIQRFVQTWTSTDHAEAVDAFFEKRAARFQGR